MGFSFFNFFELRLESRSLFESNNSFLLGVCSTFFSEEGFIFPTAGLLFIDFSFEAFDMCSALGQPPSFHRFCIAYGALLFPLISGWKMCSLFYATLKSPVTFFNYRLIKTPVSHRCCRSKLLKKWYLGNLSLHQCLLVIQSSRLMTQDIFRPASLF